MHASNKPDSPTGPGPRMLSERHAAVVGGLWAGSLGRTVRCVPTRRTVAVEVDGEWVFGKWRTGHRRTAAAEWRWLHLLPLIGLRAAEPIAWWGKRGQSLLVTAGVPGRALDAWAVDALHGGWLRELVEYACTEVAAAVRRLHEHGIVYRDLYWNHVFAEDPRAGGPPVFLDVERLLRPRWRWTRWVVKDLAGLWASVPVPVSGRTALRFLRHYLGEPLRLHRRSILAIAGKANRIRRHVPRYG